MDKSLNTPKSLAGLLFCWENVLINTNICWDFCVPYDNIPGKHYENVYVNDLEISNYTFLLNMFCGYLGQYTNVLTGYLSRLTFLLQTFVKKYIIFR